MVLFTPDDRHLIAGGLMKIWDINNPVTPSLGLTPYALCLTIKKTPPI